MNMLVWTFTLLAEVRTMAKSIQNPKVGTTVAKNLMQVMDIKKDL